ncbi:MAG: universal stress protein [Novosphingobium sp.]|uniref:universal stress protein n=1 Tax=Novosphingobium sp. TaxID=1874826 RepID=UPI0017A556D1|nr:universal stress protein [Novosphingobium sp.]
MRSILVQAGRDSGMAARLDTAMGIARALAGHITLVIDTPVDRFVTVDPYGGTFVAREALEAALAEDDALAKTVAQRLQNDDVPFDVAQFEAQPVEAMASAARLADLAVVSRSCGYAGDLAVSARCPVLALPDRAELALPLAVACIAWDGGDEAAQALRGAIPLLQGCEAVHLLTVLTDKPAGFPPTDALRYLSRHGIKAELTELERGLSIEETLAEAVTRLGAQLLVMGAFGHSRVREFLFGGVTRYFLDEPGFPPLLLAH